MASGRLGRLGKFCTSFQGEVNETNDRRAGRISYKPSDGPEVIRGAHLCLYTIREASQGTPVFVKVDAFLDRDADEADDLKAFHHRYERAGFQRKSPQNNFRRLIAGPVKRDTFLMESISYVPSHHCNIPLEIVLAVLNSKLADWYFRLGSTNAMVGEYQFNNLPCPIFAAAQSTDDQRLEQKALAALRAGDTARVFEQLQPSLAQPPFPLSIRSVLIESVRRITEIETARGEIPRTARSALDPAAQPFQDLIDRLLYAMAGLSSDEIAGLEQRLTQML